VNLVLGQEAGQQKMKSSCLLPTFVVLFVCFCVLEIFCASAQQLVLPGYNFTNSCKEAQGRLNSSETYQKLRSELNKYYNDCIANSQSVTTQSTPNDVYASCYDVSQYNFKGVCAENNGTVCQQFILITGFFTIQVDGEEPTVTKLNFRFASDICVPNLCWQDSSDENALIDSLNTTDVGACKSGTTAHWPNCTSSAYISCRKTSIGVIITLAFVVCLIIAILVGGTLVYRSYAAQQRLLREVNAPLV